SKKADCGLAVNMPYAVAAADASGHNYASGRLDYQVYNDARDTDRDDSALECLDKLFLAWLDEAFLIPNFLPAGLPPIAEWEWNWLYGPREHVDPAKEATAIQTRLSTHTTTLADEWAAR